jgi:hypothetical protein
MRSLPNLEPQYEYVRERLPEKTVKNNGSFWALKATEQVKSGASAVEPKLSLDGRQRAAVQPNRLPADEPARGTLQVRSERAMVYFCYCFRHRLEFSRFNAAQFMAVLTVVGEHCSAVTRASFRYISTRISGILAPSASRASRLCQEMVVLPWKERVQPAPVEAIVAAARKVSHASRT